MKHFFFAKQSATGFGTMRIAWAAVTIIFLLLQAKDATWYYGESGIIPSDISAFAQRTEWRFALFEWLQWLPYHSAILWLLLLVSLLLCLVGYKTRISTIISYLLLLALHERNTFILGGGDTLLRSIGFLLAISPGIHALSVDRLLLQRKHWLASGKLLAAVQMPAWPWRLLLWQMIVLYAASLWTKLLGTAWLAGTAADMALHNAEFSRIPLFADILSPLSPVISYGVLVFHAGWLLLLVPRPFATAILGQRVASLPLRRFLQCAGVLFHGSIALLLDAGVFSFAIFTAYLGLTSTEDRLVLQHLLPGRALDTTVFYDGTCSRCRFAAFLLHMVDRTHRLRLVNIVDTQAIQKYAPDISENALQEAMHVRLPQGGVVAGFDAIRGLLRVLPICWPALPLMYLPGAKALGTRMYARIAANRHCSTGNCAA